MPGHFRKISKHVFRQLEQIDGSQIIVGCLAVLKSTDINSGAYSHLELALGSDGAHYQAEVLPPASQGKFSKRNTDGWTETRKDWPKESYTIAIEAPNWHNSGTHTVYQDRVRFPKLHHAPAFSVIRFKCLDSSAGRDSYTFKCELDVVLDRTKSDFDDSLLVCLNLLQENLGVSGVAKPNATFADYVKSLRVSWDVLPPGTRDEAIQRIFGTRVPTDEQKAKVGDRYKFLMSFKPQAMIYGRSGFHHYFGAQLQDDIVVFENVEHGNAVYVMFDDWETLSQKSRIELLSGRCGRGFERVVHTDGWKDRVLNVVQTHRRTKNT